MHTVHKYFKPYLSPGFSPPPLLPKDKKYSLRIVLILVFLFLKSVRHVSNSGETEAVAIAREPYILLYDHSEYVFFEVK